MAKPVLVSGIQPTGKLHIGNHLGALKNFVELQDSGKYECYFFIADLHSLTEDFNPREKSKQILDLTTDYLAAGLSPKKSVIFQQSEIPAHTELSWIFETIAPPGEMRRMTQYKEKSEHDPKNLNIGLLTYPALMAADILMYDAKFVPVGNDQGQHLELTRTLARKFNKRFGKTFLEPKALFTKTPRVMSLDDPGKKMSKSRPAGCLFLDDSPETIRKKIMSAVTDSDREIKHSPSKPAISNLIDLYGGMSRLSTQEVEKKFKGASYAEFKKDLAEVVIDTLKPFQEKKKKLKTAEVKKTLEAGNKKANAVASKKILEIKKKVGLLI
jgi:tryptophanyl-tRNA synthetase